jgi:hypothetical protein
VGERQCSKKDGVDGREDRRARADAEGKRHNRRDGEAWIEPQLTRPEAEVEDETLQPAEPLLVAGLLREARQVAELPERATAGLVRRHSGGAIGRYQPLEMCAHLFGDFGIDVAAAPQRPQLEANLPEPVHGVSRLQLRRSAGRA